jgi:pSer/pThr/pTyr-binding forkhead associated (FHA) protein
VLTLDDGDTYTLTRDVVLGREPAVDELVVAGKAQPVRIADEDRTVSRAHALIRLVGWDVFLEDRSSANGTFVRTASHQPWHRLAADERIALTAGASVRLGERELGFEQHSVV